MKIAVIGAGGIGGLVGARLALAGEDVTFVVRGANLAAIRSRGVRLIEADGSERVARHVAATDRYEEAGPQDLVILAMKAHQVEAVADPLRHLLGRDTAIVPMQNGIPYWYFHRHGGRLQGSHLQSVDPGGAIAARIDPERVIGCVVYPASDLEAPGVVRHLEGDRFPLGELDGSSSERVRRVSASFVDAGFKAPVLDDIRSEIWLKLWGNLAFNPISALAHATLVDICRFSPTRELAAAMMAEAQAVAAGLGVTFRVTLERRIAGAEKVGAHKTSMLQDVEAGRAPEIEALVGSVVELARLTGTPTPHIDTVYALTRLLARTLDTQQGRVQVRPLPGAAAAPACPTIDVAAPAGALPPALPAALAATVDTINDSRRLSGDASSRAAVARGTPGRRGVKNATLRQLKVFEAVARLRSFSRAAEELHLSQPAVSTQVRKLEGHAGHQLFEQVGKKIFLTPAATDLLAISRAIIQQFEAAENAMAQFKGVSGGKLNVGVISAGDYFLPRLLVAFAGRHVGVRLNLTVHNREGLLQHIADNLTDLAVMVRPPPGADIVHEPFAPHPYVIIAPPTHRLAGRARIPLARLLREPFVVRERGSDTWTSMEEAFGGDLSKIDIAMEIRSTETIKQAVQAGMGVSFLSAHTVVQELRMGSLAVLDVAGFPLTLSWHVVHRRTKVLPPVAEAFKNFLLEEGAALIAAR